MRNLKIELVDLLRSNFINPNTNVSSQGVFPDEPRKDLSYNSYPRVQVVDIDSSEEYVGIGGTDVKINWNGQIRIFVKQATKNDQLLEIEGEVYADHKLIDYIAGKIREILAKEVIEMNCIMNYRKLSETEPLLDVEKGRYVKFINFRIDYIETYE